MRDCDILHQIKLLRVITICLICFSLISNLATAAIPPWEIDALVQKDTPAFQIVDLTGNNISNKDLRDKVVLLNFWATWCAPCREEMPALSKLYSRFKDKGLIIVGVSIDSSEKLVKSFLETNPVSFPIATDIDSKIADLYKVYTYPTTFLIDKHGVVQEYFLGGQEWNDPSFVAKIKALFVDDGAICKGTVK